MIKCRRKRREGKEIRKGGRRVGKDRMKEGEKEKKRVKE